MATIAVQTLSRDGITPTHAALATGDDFVNDGLTSIFVKNNDASPTTLSVPFENTVDGATVPAKSITVAAGAETDWGPFPRRFYAASLTITITNDTDVTGYFRKQLQS